MNLSKKTLQSSLIILMALLIPVVSSAVALEIVNEMRQPLEGTAPDRPVAYEYYLAYLEGDFTLAPPLPPPVPLSSTPPVDFTAVRNGLKSQGLDLAFNKIGFHVGYGGNLTGLGDWMVDQDAAGVPFFLKSADVAGPLYDAQLLAQASDVPHTLVFRLSTAGQNDGYDYDVPNYDLPPNVAAAIHWQRHLDKFPPELDPSIVWIETINEVDKGESVWLAEFATATAELALADGYRWAAFGWSSGEPEPYHWESPEMLDFLRLAAQHPDSIAIALHEYSYSVSDIGAQYPHLLGRFQALFQACDERGILRPTVLITEWGWESTQVPDPAIAMTEIEWAAWLFAAYPQIRGAAIWYLGGGYNGIADQAQELIAPLREYSLSHYFAYSPGTAQIDPLIFNPPPNNRDDQHTVVFPFEEKGSLNRGTRSSQGRGSTD